MQRGKVVVVSMLVLGLGLAVFAWQWNRSRGRQAAEFWGADVAKLIRSGTKVEAFRLDSRPHPPGEPPGDALVLAANDERWSILETKDVSKAPGLLHARNALLEDASFDRTEPSAAAPQFAYAVRFATGDKQAVIFFAPETRQVRSDHNPTRGVLVEKVSEGWRKAFERYFAQPAGTLRQ